VEVYWARDAEAYVTPVAADQVGVAILYGGHGGGFDRLLGRFPALLSRLDAAEPCSAARGAGPFAQGALGRVRGRVALVGDAAGYLDALTGEGLTLGMRCGQALADVLADGAPLADYEARYRTLSRAYYRSTALLLAIAARPRLRHGVIRALATWPTLFEAILAAHGRHEVLGVGALLRALRSPLFCDRNGALAE
jgi:flavin-dependent dehydrogenase